MRSLAVALLFSVASAAWADDPTFEITLKDHKFTPQEVSVPSNIKLRLVVKNEDPTPAEFESKKLNREKVIPGRSQATIFVGPLKPGEYAFVDEYHEASATGKLIAK